MSWWSRAKSTISHTISKVTHHGSSSSSKKTTSYSGSKLQKSVSTSQNKGQSTSSSSGGTTSYSGSSLQRAVSSGGGSSGGGRSSGGGTTSYQSSNLQQDIDKNNKQSVVGETSYQGSQLQKDVSHGRASTSPSQVQSKKDTKNVNQPGSSLNNLAPGQKPKMISKAVDYGEYTKEYGKIKGSVKYAGDYLGGKYKSFEYGIAAKYPGTYQLWNTEATGNIISSGTSIGAYFTPVGPELLVAGGVEDIATPSGRARIGSRGKLIGEKTGIGKTGGTIASYSLTGAEIGLGAVGVRGQYKNLQAIRSESLLNKAPVVSDTIRIKTDVGGVDIIKASKTTKPTFFDKYGLNIKPQRLTSEITQPFIKVRDSKIMLEGGKGTSKLYTLGKKDVQYSMFKTGGRSITGGTVKQVSISKGLKTSQLLDDVTGNYGKVYTQTTSKGTASLKTSYDPLRSMTHNQLKVIAQPSNIKTTAKFVGGGTSEKAGTSYVFSGSPGKLRIYGTGQKTLTSKNFNLFGRIRIIDKTTQGSDMFSTGGSLKTSFSGGSGLGYQQKLTELGMGSVVPKTVTTPTSTTTGIGGLTSNLKTSLKQTTKQPSVSVQKIEQKTITKPKQDIAVGQGLIQSPKLKTSTKTRGASITSQRTIPAVIQQPRQNTIPAIVPAITPKLTPELKTGQGMGIPNSPVHPTVGGGGIPPPFFKFPFGVGKQAGLGKIGAKRTYRYTPSFSSFAINKNPFRVGKITKRRFTGLEYRGAKAPKNLFLPLQKKKKKTKKKRTKKSSK